MKKAILCSLALFSLLTILTAQEKLTTFKDLDVFKIQYASDPQIAPDGDQIVYRRTGFDIMHDKSVGNLWILQADGTAHRKLTAREASESQPRWSPNGDRIAFVSSTDQGAEIFMYWVQTGQYARISQLERSPTSLTWSSDGTQLAFTMLVPQKPVVLAKLPQKPKGAKWAEKPRITNQLKHEADGRGHLEPGFSHIFVIPASGGSPRQITGGNFNHRSGLSWSPDGKHILFSANRNEDWEHDFRNSELYKVSVTEGTITTLTDRNGPDYAAVFSPDGNKIAYLGYDDKVQAYQLNQLYLMNSDGADKKVIQVALDRNLSNLQWDAKGNGLYFTYDDQGNSKIGYTDLDGKVTKLANNLGGTSIGRPYAGGSYSVSKKGTIIYTHTRPEYPADIALLKPKQKTPKLLTRLNDHWLSHRTLGKVEEVWYASSIDGRKIQGWLIKPPNYDATKAYPLLVENHGGPILNYGDRFSAELQLYAAAGYLVFYPNPRGSTSYGEEFGNLLYNNYPGEDYNDVMDGVDYLIKTGIADKEELYVTGGSAGGIMTAWIIGKNNRFKAAVVAKPVMNWISKTLVADNYYGYANYRYPGQPWENMETYWKFSPISLVGNIETPTMVMVGMNDLRTPPSEAKQLYHALKLRKIETVLVEIPGASHGIAKRPSQLITKVAHTLAWFDKYQKKTKE
ncbi:alpha/beta hydrolase family protein [Aquimarina intermedia]|uniref:Dipeptidyl aminopeptidase/acylaminoacyl peptidase n=1 Tax=Aquimarina intermedia TaxID=350814 RepID=A0A5S5BXR7_9FLAO|nr:S9 family peptidase [Aquimarina intermedia]TYP70930.1 dipeptidyl aminopeptidase/acylaminoacyl peptidase [Aquimarina intermedia]